MRGEPARAHQIERQRQLGDRVLGLGDIGGAHLREILALQHLAARDGQPRVDFGSGRRPRACWSPANSASWIRARPAAAAPCARRRLRQHRAISFSSSRACGKTCGMAGRTGTVFAPLHEDGVQRPVEILARADAGAPRAPRAHRAPRPARRQPAARNARAK